MRDLDLEVPNYVRVEGDGRISVGSSFGGSGVQFSLYLVAACVPNDVAAAHKYKIQTFNPLQPVTLHNPVHPGRCHGTWVSYAAHDDE